MEAHDDRLANNWANIAAGPIAQSKAGANIDLVNLTNAAIGLAGTVLGVIALVATPAAPPIHNAGTSATPALCRLRPGGPPVLSRCWRRRICRP